MASFVADVKKFKNELYGNGQCVAFVRQVTNIPPTTMWRQGALVKGNLTIRRGTVIATFINGVYPSLPTGNHAAIYDSQTPDGIVVWDQWKNKRQTQVVHKHTIRFKKGEGSASNDGDRFYVVEVP